MARANVVLRGAAADAVKAATRANLEEKEEAHVVSVEEEEEDESDDAAESEATLEKEEEPVVSVEEEEVEEEEEEDEEKEEEEADDAAKSEATLESWELNSSEDEEQRTARHKKLEERRQKKEEEAEEDEEEAEVEQTVTSRMAARKTRHAIGITTARYPTSEAPAGLASARGDTGAHSPKGLASARGQRSARGERIPKSARSSGAETEGSSRWSEESEESEEDDGSWKDDMEERAGVKRRCRCCGTCRARLKRMSRSCRKRRRRLCRPCSRFVQCMDRLWLAFDHRCRPLAFAMKCLLCPLFMVLRCVIGFCGCKRYKPKPEEIQSDGLSPRDPYTEAVMSARAATSARALRRSPSAGVSVVEVVEDKGPERSKLKRPKPRMRKDQMLRAGQRKDAIKSARAELRAAFGRSGSMTPHTAHTQGTTGPEAEGADATPVVFKLGWKAWLPWNWQTTYEIWKASRLVFWDQLETYLSTMEEEEEFDYGSLDENGMPKKKYHAQPRWVRRCWRTFIFAYWDPVVEYLPSARSILLASRWLLSIIPVSLHGVAWLWLIQSLTYNMEFVEGECQIETLPEKFVTEKGITTTVTGRYLVRRFFQPSAERTEGFVLSHCNVKVECMNEDLGRGDTAEDDRCDSFEMWAWKDPIACFYRQDDFYGDNGSELYCLGRPSTLQQEMFAVVISGGGLLLSLLAIFLILWRRAMDARHARKHLREMQEQQEREHREREEQVEREEAEARRQAAKQQLVDDDDDNEKSSHHDVTFADQ